MVHAVSNDQKIANIEKIILGWQRMIYGAETCATKIFEVITDTPHQPTVTYQVKWSENEKDSGWESTHDTIDEAMAQIKDLNKRAGNVSSSSRRTTYE